MEVETRRTPQLKQSTIKGPVPTVLYQVLQIICVKQTLSISSPVCTVKYSGKSGLYLQLSMNHQGVSDHLKVITEAKKKLKTSVYS